MKRMMVAVLGAVLISAVGMYAQAKPEPASKDKGSKFTGCLVPGSEQGTFMLLKAKEKGQKSKDLPNYVLAEENKDVDIQHFQTMEVEVTGAVSGTGSKTVLTVSKIKRVSDYCG
jgi:hypothetical protein